MQWIQGQCCYTSHASTTLPIEKKTDMRRPVLRILVYHHAILLALTTNQLC
jgi:hypothetical protein